MYQSTYKVMRGIYSLTALVVSCVTLLSSVVEAKSSTGDRVLVLLDSLAEKDLYTQFWHQLEGTFITIWEISCPY